MKVYTMPVGTMGTNCYIAADGDICAVIDPGFQAEKLISFLREHKLRPEYILLTHGHYDHIGAVRALRDAFGCKLAIGRGDEEMLADRKKSLAIMRGMTDEDYILTPDERLDEGGKVTVGGMTFEVIDTPGHTAGGVTYRCGDVLFTGDTLFAGDIGRIDLYGGDYGEMMASLQKLSKLEGDYRVLPGHGPETTLARERRSNPYINRNPGYDAFY